MSLVMYWAVWATFFGNIAEKRFSLMVCGLTICLFMCLSCSCIVLKRQKISTRFLLHTTAPCLSQIALKFGLVSQRPTYV